MRRVVDWASVIGIDEAQVNSLIALIHIGHTGHRELEEFLAENSSALRIERQRGPLVEDRPHVVVPESPQGKVADFALVLIVAIDPSRMDLCLAHGLLEVLRQAFLAQRRKPRAG